MDKFKHIIKMAQQFLYCPICKRRYTFEEIKLRGWFDNIYFLQVDCTNKHQPISISVIVSTEPISNDMIKTFKNQNIKSNKKIKNNQELMSEVLKDFNGDFTSLWNQSN